MTVTERQTSTMEDLHSWFPFAHRRQSCMRQLPLSTCFVLWLQATGTGRKADAVDSFKVDIVFNKAAVFHAGGRHCFEGAICSRCVWTMTTVWSASQCNMCFSEWSCLRFCQKSGSFDKMALSQTVRSIVKHCQSDTNTRATRTKTKSCVRRPFHLPEHTNQKLALGTVNPHTPEPKQRTSSLMNIILTLGTWHSLGWSNHK